MKKILLILYFLAMLSTHLYSQWTQIFPKYTSNQFQKISGMRFIDSRTGFAAIDGMVIRTTDGGESWDSVFTLTELPYYSRLVQFFIDTSLGYIATYSGVIKTTDGGSSWSKFTFERAKYVIDIYMVDNQTGYLLCDAEILKTTNGGDSWFTINYKQGKKLYFLDRETGFVLDEHTLYKTTDGGTTWSSKSLANTGSICFVNSETGYMTGSKVIYKTTDRGDTWESKNVTNYFLHLISVFFPDLKTGYTANDRYIYKTTNEGNTWEQLELPEESPQINSINFVSTDTGYAACDAYGSIIKTTDGGKNWFDTDGIYIKKEFWSIGVTKHGNVYIAGSRSTILKSENGFDNWTKMKTEISDRLFSIDFIDEDTGFAAGESGTIIKTTDSGITWNKLDYKSSSLICACYITEGGTAYGISPDYGKLFKSTDRCLNWTESNLNEEYMSLPYFIDENTGYISSPRAIYKTTDAGNKWLRVFYNENLGTYFRWPGIRSISFVNDQTGFVVFANAIIKTTNSGQSWNIYYKPAGHAGLETIFFVNEKVGYAAGSWGTIMKTDDGGESWHFIEGGRSAFSSIYFRNENEGIIVGSGGCVMKTTNGGGPFVTDVKFSEGSAPENYELMQNYPNPFNPVTTISYSIPEQALVELKVFDMLGREVSTLVNKEQSSGKYNVQFDGSSLPSGIYIYSINAGNYKSSKKLVLLK